MSVGIDSAAAAQVVTRATYDNTRARPPVTSTPEPNTTPPAPERAADLTRQLEQRLNTEIARIRQRVDTGNSAASPDSSVGRRLDIRA